MDEEKSNPAAAKTSATNIKPSVNAAHKAEKAGKVGSVKDKGENQSNDIVRAEAISSKAAGKNTPQNTTISKNKVSPKAESQPKSSKPSNKNVLTPKGPIKLDDLPLKNPKIPKDTERPSDANLNSKPIGVVSLANTIMALKREVETVNGAASAQDGQPSFTISEISFDFNVVMHDVTEDKVEIAMSGDVFQKARPDQLQKISLSMIDLEVAAVSAELVKLRNKPE